jgi:hypothetical protein
MLNTAGTPEDGNEELYYYTGITGRSAVIQKNREY